MPDDAELVDRILHIEDMKDELQAIAGGQALYGKPDASDVSPELEEQFLEYMLAFERADWTTHREILTSRGVALPLPDQLTDHEISAALAAVIQGLADVRTYLLSTDHLSDRELYSLLLSDTLNQETPLLPPELETNCRIDLVSGGSDEDIELWMTYYADEKTRLEWAERYPDFAIPPRRDPPYDRDRHLPRPPGE